MFTLQVFLPNDVVKQLSVVGVHPPAAGTCHYLLLSVTAQVLSQLRTPFSRSFTICGMTELRLHDPTLWLPSLASSAVKFLDYNVAVINQPIIHSVH